MEIKYVNLGSTTSGHAGTSIDPYSWADVISRLQSIASTVTVDGAVINLEFRLRGFGDVFTVENSTALDGMKLSPESRITFKSDNPWQYGLAVLRHPAIFGAGATAQGPNTAFMRFTNSIRLNVQFQNVVFDVNNPLSAANWRMLDIQGPIGSTVVAENCIVLDRGSACRFLSITGADTASKAAIVGNTVLYSSTAYGAHEFARVEGSQLFTGRNYTGQDSASNSIVNWATVTGTHFTGGNAYALLSSALIYNGSTPRQLEADAIGLNVQTQGVWNPHQFNLNNEDPFTYGNPGIPPVRTSVFWPVHGGLLLGLGSTPIDSSISLGTGVADALGLSRNPIKVDAGAFQKTAMIEDQKIFVDLALNGLSDSYGTEADPISKDDLVLDYKRRAPIDCNVTYSLRGDNSAAPISEFDLGPLSPNPSALNAKYTGAGSVTLVGWRTYRKTIPVFSVRKFRPNASLLVQIQNMKLEFAGSGTSTNFFESDVASTAKFRVSNSIIRSIASAQGKIAVSGLNHARFQFFGCSIHVMHSNGVTNGIFSSAGSAFDIDLCAINLPNVSVLGSGGSAINIRATLVNTGSSGTATWFGANFDSHCQLNAAQPFIDPSNASYASANFSLINASSAVAIAPLVNVLSSDGAAATTKDILGLIRSAFPIGSQALDAGAYEQDYYIPTASDYYLDLGKTRSGKGIVGDRWSPADFQNWIDTTEFLDREVVVHATRSGPMHLVLSEIDADTNGKLTVVSEQLTQPAVWNADNFDALSGISAIPVTVRSMIMAASEGADLIELQNGNLNLTNSILIADRAAKNFVITVGAGVPTPGDVITLTVGSIVSTLVSPTHWTVGATPIDTAISIANALNTAGFTARAYDSVSKVRVTYVDNVALGTNPNILGVSQTATMISSANIVAAGCSFSEYFEGALTVASTIISANNAKISHCALQGHHLSGTTYTSVGIASVSGDVKFCGYNEVNTLAQGALPNNNIAVGHQLFAIRHSVGYDLSGFELNGSELVDIVDVSALPDWEPEWSAVDLRGRMRSQAFVDPTKAKYDAGALERNYLDSSTSYDNAPGSAFLEVTDLGIQLDARSAMGDVVFKLIGFAVGTGGYLYWDPTQVLTTTNNGSPLLSAVSITGSNWASDVLTVVTPIGATSVRAGADFDVTSNDSSIIIVNIANALRLSPNFNKGAWCKVVNNTLEVRSWAYGAAATGYSINVVGLNMSASSFSSSSEPQMTAGTQWPSSGHAPWFKFEKPDPRSVSFVARLDTGDANGSIGELVAIAQIVASPIAGEVGREYPYARVRLPLHVKHDREILVRRLMFAH